MVDLDSTQIINADESLLQTSPTFDTEASLKILSGADTNTYPITKEIIIGRSNPSDLVIGAASLSKRHAKISYNNGQYFITDLGSSNKTFQNKVQLQPNVCYALHDGDEIKLGDLVCSFHEQKLTKTNDRTVEQNKVDVIPSTQTITDSYDNEEPTQPIKIWNGNSNNIARLSRTSVKSSDENISKQNSIEESTSNGSSFVSSSLTATVPLDDGSLVIGSSTLLATVPLEIESTQINDDQSEIISSTETKQVIEENFDNSTKTNETKVANTTEIEIENTQTYTLESADELTNVGDSEMAETQAYDLQTEPPAAIETKHEEVCKVINVSDKQTEGMTTTIAPIENRNPPMETLAYDLQPAEETVKIENKTTEICMDTQVYDIDEQIDKVKSTDVPEMTNSTPAVNEPEKVEDSVPIDKILTEKTQTANNEEIFQETLINDHMETEHNESLTTDAPVEQKQSESIETLITTIPENLQIPSSNAQNVAVSNSIAEEMMIDKVEKVPTESNTISPTEHETVLETNQSAKLSFHEADMVGNKSANPTGTISSTIETEEQQTEDVEDEDIEDEKKEKSEETSQVSSRTTRGVPRRNARRARGRRGGARARVVSTRIYGARRNAIVPVSIDNGNTNTTLEETIQSETEESPQKTMPTETEAKIEDTQPITSISEASTNETAPINQANSNSNIRVSARIKARVSSGRNRQFPYTDDYVDLDDLEKQSKMSNVTISTTNRKSTRGGRGSSTPQKRISVRQQPADSSESPDEKVSTEKSPMDVYEDMDTGGENEEPKLRANGTSVGRKRKSTTPVSSATTKRTRSTTPQTAVSSGTHRKQNSELDQASPTVVTTPKRTRKSARSEATAETSTEQESSNDDRPVRIALSSHLNFDPNHLDALRKLGFEIMDESCHVDALVVDRIRRTKKFFMCLARGAHILSPTWIETMIKQNHYVPYDKYYLEDTVAEARYGFQLRESVRLARQHPIFQNYKVFCTKDTSPPYDDLKDIVEAAGGKFVDKINMNRPGKDLLCIVAQSHKNEYEDLHKKGVPIVGEEFALSGVSKQKLDFVAFSLFQNAGTTVKTAATK